MEEKTEKQKIEIGILKEKQKIGKEKNCILWETVVR